MSKQKERLDFEHEHAEGVFEAGLDTQNFSFDKNAFGNERNRIATSEFAKHNPKYMKLLNADTAAYGENMEKLCGNINAIRNDPKMSDEKKNAKLGKIARKCENAVSRMDAGKYDFGGENRTKVYKYMTRHALVGISESLKGGNG